MEFLDYLAWGVMVFLYAAIIVPLIGSTNDYNEGYFKAMKLGLVIHGFLVAFTAILFGSLWAFFRIIG